MNTIFLRSEKDRHFKDICDNCKEEMEIEKIAHCNFCFKLIFSKYSHLLEKKNYFLKQTATAFNQSSQCLGQESLGENWLN